MMNMLVSIIIPIYNVESYLCACLNSILQQSYNNWEAILVDDGSTDNSGAIARSYAVKDQRFRYYQKVNGGLSSARNFGIDKSQGEYLIFVDSDDFWLIKTSLESLVTYVKEQELDILRGEYVRVDEKGDVLQTNATSAYDRQDIVLKQCLDSYEMMKKAIQGEYFSWLFLFKKSLFDNIRFDDSRKFQEDIDFAARLFCRSLRCGYLSLPFYAYRQREHSSIMSTPRLTNLYFSFLQCYTFWNCIVNLEDKRLVDEYLYRGIMTYYWTLETVASDIYYSKFDEIQRDAHLILLQKEVRKRMKILLGRSFPIQCYVSPSLGVRLFRLRWMIGKVLRKLHILK